MKHDYTSVVGRHIERRSALQTMSAILLRKQAGSTSPPEVAKVRLTCGLRSLRGNSVRFFSVQNVEMPSMRAMTAVCQICHGTERLAHSCG